MKKLTMNLLLIGATTVLASQAIAGGNHFHAQCAFKSCCESAKTNDEIKNALPTAVELLGLESSWNEAKMEGDFITPKPGVIQFDAKNPKTAEVKRFSFSSNGTLLGAKKPEAKPTK